MITRKSVRIFTNTNAMLKRINRQYDSQYSGSDKIGSQLRIRIPPDYVVSTGPAFQPQDSNDNQIVLTMATQNHVDMAFTSVDLALSVEDFAERYLYPAMNNLAGEIAASLMSTVGEAAPNLVANVDANNDVLAPTQHTFLRAKAALSNNSAPRVKSDILLDPDTMAETVSSLAGLLNPASAISRQYMEGEMYDALQAFWYEDQNVIKHTVGSFTAGTVAGAGQTGTTLLVNAITGTLALGDVITIAGVVAVNYVQKRSQGKLRQFVLTAAAANGATSLSIFPAIIPSVGGNAVQNQTVVASPAGGAAISLVLNPGVTYVNNLRYAPEAITMAMGDMPIPNDVKASRAVYDKASLRYVQQYIIGSDQSGRRTDALWGAVAPRAQWMCKVAAPVVT